MRKMICILLAAVLCLSSVGAVAAVEYSLPEKLQRQIEFGNGLKGTLTIHAEGSADWAQLLAPLRDVPLEIRAIRSDGKFQYKLYALEDENMIGLTQLYGDENAVYLKSDLMDQLLTWHTGGDALQALAGEAGNNPTLYSAMLNIISVPETSWKGKWEPALSAYESSIELWLNDYASAPSVLRGENGATVLVRYDIPAAMVKEKIKSMWAEVLQDETLLTLLKPQMTEEQQQAYLNPGLQYFYDQVIDAIPLTGSVVLEREMTAKGDVLRTDMSFPLAWGTWTEMNLMQNGNQVEIRLNGTEKAVQFVVDNTASTPDSDSYNGSLCVAPLTGEDQGIAVAFALTEIRSSSVDEDTRSHEVTTWNISLKQDENAEGDEWFQMAPVDAFVKVHLHSKSLQGNAVTLEVASTLSWADAELSIGLDLITRSPWVLEELPIEGAVNAAEMPAEELVQLFSDMGLNGLTMLMMNQQAQVSVEQATQTDLQ